MRILGIDPGIGRLGWGIVDSERTHVQTHGFGCVETKPNSDIPGRLYAIYDEVCRIMDEYKPDSVAIEDLFFF